MITITHPVDLTDTPPLISTRQACRLLSISVSTLQRLRNQPNFPQPYMIGLRAHGWVEAELIEWFASRRLGR